MKIVLRSINSSLIKSIFIFGAISILSLCLVKTAKAQCQAQQGDFSNNLPTQPPLCGTIHPEQTVMYATPSYLPVTFNGGALAYYGNATSPLIYYFTSGGDVFCPGGAFTPQITINFAQPVSNVTVTVPLIGLITYPGVTDINIIGTDNLNHSVIVSRTGSQTMTFPFSGISSINITIDPASLKAEDGNWD